MLVTDTYFEETVDRLSKMHPELPLKAIKEIVQEDMEENLVDPKMVIENNYEETINDTTVSQVVELLYNNPAGLNLIITGNGTLFLPHELKESQLSYVCKHLGDSRNIFKDKMIEHLNDEDPTMKNHYNMVQLTYKLLNNSLYGVIGMNGSVFYNPFVAPAITYTGVVSITNAIIGFEWMLGNNIMFFTPDEVYSYVDRILKDLEERESLTDIDLIISKENQITEPEELADYLLEKVQYDYDSYEKGLLISYLSTLTQDQLTRIYYKNNFTKFNDLQPVNELIGMISKYDFIGEDPSPEHKELLDGYRELLEEFVFHKHIPIEFYKQAAFETRTTSIITDTDSTFINFDKHARQFAKAAGISIDGEENRSNLFNVLNSLIYVSSNYIDDIMWKLTGNFNITSEEARKKLDLAPEYIYKRIMNTENKKQYAGILIAQEGVPLDKPKLDIKGLSIKKNNVNLATREFFSNLLEEKILLSENIDIVEILKDFREYETKMYEELKKRSTAYLIPTYSNSESNYKNPYGMAQFRSVKAWNMLNLGEEIQLPVTIMRIPLVSGKTVSSLPVSLQEKYPEIYDEIVEKFYGDHPISAFGFDNLGVPQDESHFPEFISEVIDYEKIISTNITSGEIILKSLDVFPMVANQPRKSSDKRRFSSNIIRF